MLHIGNAQKRQIRNFKSTTFQCDLANKSHIVETEIGRLWGAIWKYGTPCFLNVRFPPLCFYERPRREPVFTKWKKSKEDFHFDEKRRNEPLASLLRQPLLAVGTQSSERSTASLPSQQPHSPSQHQAPRALNSACEHLHLILIYSVHLLAEVPQVSEKPKRTWKRVTTLGARMEVMKHLGLGEQDGDGLKLPAPTTIYNSARTLCTLREKEYGQLPKHCWLCW